LSRAACDSTGDTTTSTGEATETTAAPVQATTTTTEEPSVEGFTYNVGIFADIGRPNYWAYLGPDGTVPMEAVFGPTNLPCSGSPIPAS
jgi:hypothetical protein